MVSGVQNRVFLGALPPLKPKPQPAPQPAPKSDPLDRAIEQAVPKINDSVGPVVQLIHGVEMTAPENKGIADKVSAFSERIRVLGAQLHPFVSYDHMLESWLGASPFHQSSETRDIAPLLPGLKYKGVHDVLAQDYKVVHAVAAEGWQKTIVAPKLDRIRTDYDKSESIPTECVYLCEDKKGNHVVVELRKEWAMEPPQLTVFAHDSQPELVTEFYDKLNKWVGENNFYKNKVLQYVEPPMAPPYLDFQDGLKTKPTTWQDIALAPASEELIKSNTTDFFKELPIYKENGKFACRNLLLAGPPGTGKSMVNDILIQEMKNDVTFLYVTSKSIHSQYSIAGIFDASRMMSPSVVLMEDLDLVGTADRNTNNRKDILNELLNQVSGVYDNSGVVVIGSTNQTAAFDEAMLRPLRFSTVVPMMLPDRNLRETILKKVTKDVHLAQDVNLGTIADRTENFSGAGLTELKEMAVAAAITGHSLDGDGKAIVANEHFDAALEQIRLKKEYLEKLKRDEEKEKPLPMKIVPQSDLPSLQPAFIRGGLEVK